MVGMKEGMGSEVNQGLINFRLHSLTAIILAAIIIMGIAAPAPAAAPKGKNKLGVRFAGMIMSQWPDPMTLDPNNNGWEYNSGIMLFGMTKMFEKTRDKRYLNYIKRWVDSYVEDNGNIKWDQESSHNLDYIQPATLILFLYEQTKEEKYKIAAKKVRECYDKIPKNAEGGFWHKGIHPNEMWIDGIYMAEPFIVHYGKLFGDTEFCNNTAVFQTTLVAKHTYNPKTKLLYHAWDQDANAIWVTSKTGVSTEYWSRGMGWYVMALVDILEYLPRNHPGRAQLHGLLKDVVEGLKNVQDPKTGLWFQVLDKGDKPGNWIETSGSAMYIYTIKKAIRLKYIDPKYAGVAERAWKGLQSFIETDSKGMPVLKNAARGMDVQKDYGGYIVIPRLNNSTHGLLAVQLASSEME